MEVKLQYFTGSSRTQIPINCDKLYVYIVIPKITIKKNYTKEYTQNQYK